MAAMVILTRLFPLISLLVRATVSESLPTSECAGLTIKGHNNGFLNDDYMWNCPSPVSHDGGPDCANAGQGNLPENIGAYISHNKGSIIPFVRQKFRIKGSGNGTWTITSEVGIDVHTETVAICTSGCPAPGARWAKGDVKETAWEMTGKGGSPRKMTITATTSCCQRKKQPCDDYDRSKCVALGPTSKLFGYPACNKEKCCFDILDGQYDGMPYYYCIKDKIPTVCDHQAEEQLALV